MHINDLAESFPKRIQSIVSVSTRKLLVLVLHRYNQVYVIAGNGLSRLPLYQFKLEVPASIRRVVSGTPIIIDWVPTEPIFEIQ